MAIGKLVFYGIIVGIVGYISYMRYKEGLLSFALWLIVLSATIGWEWWKESSVKKAEIPYNDIDEDEERPSCFGGFYAYQHEACG